MHILDFVTNRIKASVKEITVGGMIEACQIPTAMNERGITHVLNCIVGDTNIPVEEWTVQERYACLIHYLMSVDGDIEIDDGVKLSDFRTDVTGDSINYTFVMTDEVDGKMESVVLEVQPLTAEYLEAVENIVNSGAVFNLKTKAAYELCAIAAQIIVNGDKDEGVIQELVHARLLDLIKLPASDLDYIKNQWQIGVAANMHLINYTFDDDGIVCLAAVDGEESEVAGYVPARFCFHAIYPEYATEEWGAAD